MNLDISEDEIDELRDEYKEVLKPLMKTAAGQGAVAGQAANLVAKHGMSLEKAYETVLESRVVMKKMLGGL